MEKLLEKLARELHEASKMVAKDKEREAEELARFQKAIKQPSLEAKGLVSCIPAEAIRKVIQARELMMEVNDIVKEYNRDESKTGRFNPHSKESEEELMGRMQFLFFMDMLDKCAGPINTLATINDMVTGESILADVKEEGMTVQEAYQNCLLDSFKRVVLGE